MTKSLSSSVVFASLIIAIVLMLNPTPLAFAGHPGDPLEHEGTLSLTIPACNADPNDPNDVQAFLVPGPGVGGIDPGSFFFFFLPSQNAGLPILGFDETWINADKSYIIICGLDPSTAYKVETRINNDTPELFETFDNELLDPCCDALDDSEDQAAEPFVPIGFSQSNNDDGLSFGIEVPRNSPTWDGVNPDNESTIDFLNFDDGLLLQGQSDEFMIFGLKEEYQLGAENPFLLVQQPNLFRVCPQGSFLPPAGVIIPDDCIPIPPNGGPVGGELIPLDTTMILLAGAQMNAAWMIPVVLSVIGIGLFVVSRKSENS